MPDVSSVLKFLREYDGEPLTFMEVCGTHTASISEHGIPGILSPKIRLISGPGCPVCVTVASFVDRLIDLSKEDNTTVVTFGDMIRVPGSKGTLNDAKADGGNIMMVYSPLEVLKMAGENPDMTYVFAAVGFETTTPIYAVLIDSAEKAGLKNIKLLTALKTMPAVIEKVCSVKNDITGFIAPGHVSVITGSEMFRPLAEKYSMPFIVAGFGAEELIAAIYALVKCRGKGVVKNLYKTVVKSNQNEQAAELVNKYFEPCSAAWRGLGIIENSGMCLKEEYMKYDAGSMELISDFKAQNGCRCGEVISGLISPTECPLFKKVCTPQNPQGACMVSMEGSCFHYYITGRDSK